MLGGRSRRRGRVVMDEREKGEDVFGEERTNNMRSC